MLILDTDHLTEYQRGTSPEAHRLKDRLDRAIEPYATTVITVEEIMRGWMAAIRRVNDPRRQISAYAKLQQLFGFFACWSVLPWTDAASTARRCRPGSTKENPEGKVSALTTGLTPEQTAIFQRAAWETVKNYKWAGVGEDSCLRLPELAHSDRFRARLNLWSHIR